MLFKDIVFIDIDGTLVNTGRDYSIIKKDVENLKAYIKSLAKMGVLFALNSNRSVSDILPIYKQFGFNGPIIAENGFFMLPSPKGPPRYFLNGAEISRIRRLKAKAQKEVYLFLRKRYPGLNVVWLETDTIAALKNKKRFKFSNGTLLVLNTESRRFTISLYLKFVSNGKLEAAGNEMVDLARYMSKFFRSKSDMKVVLSQFGNLLVYTTKTSKRKAVKQLLNIYNGYNLYAIGDEESDYDMVRGMGKFMAVGNAKNSVKKVADEVSKSPYTRGVIDLLHGLKHGGIVDKVAKAVESLGKYSGLSDFEPLDKKGHTQAILFSCKRGKEEMVVKIGVTPEGINEISNNLLGYNKIKEAGGGSLIPPGLEYRRAHDCEVLIMPHLGKSFTVMGKTSSTKIYKSFINYLQDLAQQTLGSNSRHLQVAGITEIKEQIGKWYGDLEAVGVIDPNYKRILKGVNPSLLSSPKSTIMILDFTPDNIFLYGGSIKFIDPWLQSTYTGSLIPCIGIFTTLLIEVYDIRPPSGIDLDAVAKSIGDMLNLDESQVERQLALGRALQLGLSSYVRINSDRKKSIHYAKRSLEELGKTASPEQKSY